MGRGRGERDDAQQGPSAISIVGPGMLLVGDLVTDGTVRIEGRVRGSIWAGKAVVVGREGSVEGELRTADAVIAGSVHGLLLASSRLEVQGEARIEGDVHARRLQLEEGAVLNGDVRMGEVELGERPELDRAFSLPGLAPGGSGAGEATGGDGNAGGLRGKRGSGSGDPTEQVQEDPVLL